MHQEISDVKDCLSPIPSLFRWPNGDSQAINRPARSIAILRSFQGARNQQRSNESYQPKSIPQRFDTSRRDLSQHRWSIERFPDRKQSEAINIAATNSYLNINIRSTSLSAPRKSGNENRKGLSFGWNSRLEVDVPLLTGTPSSQVTTSMIEIPNKDLAEIYNTVSVNQSIDDTFDVQKIGLPYVERAQNRSMHLSNGNIGSEGSWSQMAASRCFQGQRSQGQQEREIIADNISQPINNCQQCESSIDCQAAHIQSRDPHEDNFLLQTSQPLKSDMPTITEREHRRVEDIHGNEFTSSKHLMIQEMSSSRDKKPILEANSPEKAIPSNKSQNSSSQKDKESCFASSALDDARKIDNSERLGSLQMQSNNFFLYNGYRDKIKLRKGGPVRISSGPMTEPETPNFSFKSPIPRTSSIVKNTVFLKEGRNLRANIIPSIISPIVRHPDAPNFSYTKSIFLEKLDVEHGETAPSAYRCVICRGSRRGEPKEKLRCFHLVHKECRPDGNFSCRMCAWVQDRKK